MTWTKEQLLESGIQPWWPRVEPTPRWVRVRLGGELIADSRRALLFINYGPGRLPTYFFPRQDVNSQHLGSPQVKEERTVWDVRAGDHLARQGAYSYTPSNGTLAALEDHVSFLWGRGLEWFEEEDRVFVHARDPHKRVDVAASSRDVRVEVGGVTVAESRRPLLLFETSLPPRYYLPVEDVRMDLLEPSATETSCPYKGDASYFSLRLGNEVHNDIAWTYQAPIAENPRIRGLVCFFNEHIDLFVDGESMERPVTPWS